MKTWRYSYLISLAVMIMAMSCDKDPEIPNEEELITTLHYTLTPAGGGAAVVFTFRDIDGDGGQVPEITTGQLEASMIYTGAITLLNESITPAEDITTEVQEESDEHQIFYIITGVNASVQYLDEDTQGFPLGLSTNLLTGVAGEGSIRIVLRHLPVKSAAGVNMGDITNAGGETDIEVTFPLVIQ